MNYKICLYVSEIKSINRTIIVNDNIPLQLFIKSLILSMNGKTNKLFYLEHNDEIIEHNDIDFLSDLSLNIGDIYNIQYNYSDKIWNLEFEILEKNKGYNNIELEVIGGSGAGICPKENDYIIEKLITTKNDEWKNRVLRYDKNLKEYFDSEFILENTNQMIKEYISFFKELHSPKSIIMNVSLDEFDKEIKRKIIINNNILIDQLCRCIVASMNGDIDHLYTIKINKEYYDENILDEEFNFLELSVGQKFKVIYDFGDNWQFNIRISKIIDGYSENEFTVLKGTGYGIIEDCGGVYRLGNIFDGESDHYEQRDIEEFNLDKIQNKINRQLKIENLHQERIDYY